MYGQSSESGANGTRFLFGLGFRFASVGAGASAGAGDGAGETVDKTVNVELTGSELPWTVETDDVASIADNGSRWEPPGREKGARGVTSPLILARGSCLPEVDKPRVLNKSEPAIRAAADPLGR